MGKKLDIATIYDDLNLAVQYTRAGQELGTKEPGNTVLQLLHKCIDRIEAQHGK